MYEQKAACFEAKCLKLYTLNEKSIFVKYPALNLVCTYPYKLSVEKIFPMNYSTKNYSRTINNSC